jgi:hypothetical protein
MREFFREAARYVLTQPTPQGQPSKRLEHAMRSKEHIVDWDFSQRPATLLLVACVVLMAVLLVVTWIYLAAISRDIAIAASNQSESVRTLLAMSEQQAAANMRLDAVRGETNLNLRAIREELHALNEKASVAADTKPPQNSNAQP